MSRRYSSWRSLSSPNIRSSRTSENPITALSGVRSSCDMLARNSDLCRLAISSWSVLTSSSTEQARVVDGDRGLAGERLEQPARLRRELAGHRAPHDQCADDLVLAHERDGEQRPPPVAPERLGVEIELLEVEVGGLEGLTADRGAADERLVDVDPQRAEGLDELLARADAGPHLEHPRLRR